jgi:hypothetical protein
MKRIALLILAALPAWAAGSCTVSAPVQFAASASWMVSVACTGDASTGSFPAVNLKALQPLLGGYISRVETVPGTTAPTANYTMTLLDAKGGDELNGQGSGTMSSTATQIFAVGTGTPITAQETLNLSGNSVASAGVAIYLYVIAANNTMAQILALGGTVSGGGGGGGGVTSVFSRTGAVTAHTGDYSVGQVTGAAGINGSPTANAVVTDYSASLVQTPNASSTLDGSGNLGVGGSITSGVGCVTTACISSDTWYDSGATHATVQLGATTGYNGTNTWDGNAPTSGYFWGAYGVSGNNASVGWVAPPAPLACASAPTTFPPAPYGKQCFVGNGVYYGCINATGCPGGNDPGDWTLQPATVSSPTSGAIYSGTYTSGISATGSVGQTCVLTALNGGGTLATATVGLTGLNTIAPGTALVITAAGSGYTSSPTTATVGNGSATCSGTPVLSTAVSSAVSTPGFYFAYLTAGNTAFLLPVITSIGSQYCFGNYVGKSGTITLVSPASTYMAVGGTNGSSAGTLVSSGALGDSACALALATAQYNIYLGLGIWTNN